MKKLFFLFCAAFLFTLTAASTAFSQTDIRKVDFKNFTFKPFCLGEESADVKVKDGSFSEEKTVEGFKERFYFSATVEGFADVNGDGREEALINSVCNTGGTGNFTEGFIYTLQNEKPVLLARIEGGDRAYGGINAIRMEEGYLVVERFEPGENGGACCPQYSIKSRYKVRGSDLIDVGTPVKCELYPAVPIEFERGKSSTSFKMILPQYDSIRFKLGAKTGQTLRVTSSSASIYARIFEGETENIKEGKELISKLKKNGNYVFELTNSSETEQEFTVTIEIK